MSSRWFSNFDMADTVGHKSREPHLRRATVYRVYRSVIDALKPFQNTKAAKLTATTNYES